MSADEAAKEGIADAGGETNWELEDGSLWDGTLGAIEKMSDDEEDTLLEALQRVRREANSLNFLCVRFSRPGTIIWAAPNHLHSWDTPGKVLFAVRLSEYDSIVPVCVPNFDLRFQQETAWYPCKTMHERFSTLRNRINKSNMGAQIAEAQRKAQLAKKKAKEERDLEKGTEEAEGKLIDAGKSDDDNEETKTVELKGEANHLNHKLAQGGVLYTGPDGHNRAVFVHKHAFVCRLRKKKFGHGFDREQTDNWYRTALEDTFPELRAIKKLNDIELDRENVKNVFMGRFLNFRQSLNSGEDQKTSGLLKGNITTNWLEEKEEQEAVKQFQDSDQIRVDELKRQEETAKQNGGNKRGGDDGSWQPLTDMYKSITSGYGKLKEEAKADYEALKQIVVQEGPPLYRPVENLWKSAQVVIHVYVLTANELKFPSGAGWDTINPFVTVQIPGYPPQQSDKLWDIDSKKAKSMLNFYQIFPLNASVPGDNTLRLSVKTHSSLLLTDTEIGHADIDLEDRWLALQRRTQRSTTNQQFLWDNVSFLDQPFYIQRHTYGENKKTPLQQAQDRAAKENERVPRPGQKPMPPLPPVPGLSGAGAYFLNPLEADSDNQLKPLYKFEGRSDGSKPNKSNNLKIAPKLAPTQRLPVEIVDLLLEDDETGTEAKTGVLRLWVDMTLETEDYKPADLKTQTKGFEVRIVVKHIKNISIYKDIGERNDIVVKGMLRIKDFVGKEQVHRVETDPHKWANKEAMWNWRWVFKLVAPTAFCSLKLSLIDQDTMSDDDPIYDAKEYPLDHIIMLAWQAHRDAEPNLGTLKEEILFDSWPEQSDSAKAGCFRKCKCRCCCRPTKPKDPLKKAAKLFLDITVIPQDEADQNPVEDNVCIAPPRGRLDWSSAIKEPGRFMHVLLGPTLERQSKQICCCASIVFLLCVALMIFFFGSQGMAGLRF